MNDALLQGRASSAISPSFTEFALVTCGSSVAVLSFVPTTFQFTFLASPGERYLTSISDHFTFTSRHIEFFAAENDNPHVVMLGAKSFQE